MLVSGTCTTILFSNESKVINEADEGGVELWLVGPWGKSWIPVGFDWATDEGLVGRRTPSGGAISPTVPLIDVTMPEKGALTAAWVRATLSLAVAAWSCCTAASVMAICCEVAGASAAVTAASAAETAALALLTSEWADAIAAFWFAS